MWIKVPEKMKDNSSTFKNSSAYIIIFYLLA